MKLLLLFTLLTISNSLFAHWMKFDSNSDANVYYHSHSIREVAKRAMSKILIEKKSNSSDEKVKSTVYEVDFICEKGVYQVFSKVIRSEKKAKGEIVSSHYGGNGMWLPVPDAGMINKAFTITCNEVNKQYQKYLNQRDEDHSVIVKEPK